MESILPRATVIPVLAYFDANEAAAWLCKAFAFTLRLRVDTHRVQLNVGEGAVIVRELRPHEIGGPVGLGHSITVRIEDADAHCNRAREHGARIIQGLFTHLYGERQYVVEDIAGHSWTFSQSVADMLPESWDGILVQLNKQESAIPDCCLLIFELWHQGPEE